MLCILLWFNLISLVVVFIYCGENCDECCKSMLNDGNGYYYTKECIDRVYRRCLHRSTFTEQEIENARIYLQRRFQTRGYTNKPPCSRLRVRKDIKCLTRQELSDLIAVMKELYSNGGWDRLSFIHSSLWPVYHKFAETLPWHRWLVNQMENEMRKINPRVTMPYWNFISEFAAPEKSIVWDYFGHAGHPNNDFCISDGPFANIIVNNPEPHCVRRQWNHDGTIINYEPPEWITSTLQAGNYTSFRQRLGFTGHFKPHLSIGGYYGDFSVQVGTNDPIFYMYHEYLANFLLLKWQLTDDENLVPLAYNDGPRYDLRTKRVVRADVMRDVLTLWNVPVKEVFEVGFGEQCYIHDQLVEAINNKLRRGSADLPIAIVRLSTALPSSLFSRWFPNFADNTATVFHYDLPDVGACPLDKKCREMPITIPYNITANGRRQLERFRCDLNFDITPMTFQAEDQYYRFMSNLRNSGYCSPYVVTDY